MAQNTAVDMGNANVQGSARLARIFSTLFLVLAGFVMRSPIIVLPLYIDQLSIELHRSPGELGIFTSLPLLMFVVFSLCVAWLVEHINLTRTMQLGVLLIFIGSLTRLSVTWESMLIGTVLIGAGIAILNISMPTLISEMFPHKPGLYTTGYTASIAAGTIILVFISPFISMKFGWHTMLWIMLVMTAIPCAIAMFIPSIYVKKSQQKRSHAKIKLLKDTRMWLFIGMFAGQAFLNYILAAWLPTMLDTAHIDMSNYNTIMILFNVVGLPVSLVVPFFVARTRRRYHVCLLAVVTLCELVVSVLFHWNEMLGVPFWYFFAAINCIFFTVIFVMILTYYPMKATTSADTADISGLSQSVGYLIAATGPIMYGWLYGERMPSDSFVWIMVITVLINGWCGLEVIRIHKFGLRMVDSGR